MDPFADLADFAPLQYMKEMSQTGDTKSSAQDDEEFSKVLNKRVFDAMDEEAGKTKKRKNPVTEHEAQEDLNQPIDAVQTTSRKKRKIDQEAPQEEIMPEEDELYQQVLEQQKAKKNKTSNIRIFQYP